MILGGKRIWAVRAAALAAALGAGFLASGCGMPAAPLPPSLNLPRAVSDLSATRTGNQVTLAWTMPAKNTDKLLLKGPIAVRLCRREAAQSACATVAHLQLLPGAHGSFTETLPAALAAGAPRPLNYAVELSNKHGRSAGLSNAAMILAGAAPPPVAGLTAQVRKAGVILHWEPGAEAGAVRLQRTLLAPSAQKPAPGLLAPPPQPAEENLLVESAHDGAAIDKTIRFGSSYAYRAQRIARVLVDGQTLELDGPLSAPVRVEASDIFPPAVPAGLAAVATVGGDGTETAIDLSWQPDAEPDVAGYAVYRRQGDGAWLRISAQLVAGPGYHDTQVAPGHTYSYAVSAIGQNGRESARSAPAEETVPQP